MEHLPGLSCRAEGQLCEVSLIGCHAVKARMRASFIVQQGLRTPTEPRFENCCTRGIRGLLFGLPFTRRSTKLTALFFAVA